jgi:hypothetical protein
MLPFSEILLVKESLLLSVWVNGDILVHDYHRIISEQLLGFALIFLENEQLAKMFQFDHLDHFKTRFPWFGLDKQLF